MDTNNIIDKTIIEDMIKNNKVDVSQIDMRTLFNTDKKLYWKVREHTPERVEYRKQYSKKYKSTHKEELKQYTKGEVYKKCQKTYRDKIKSLQLQNQNQN